MEIKASELVERFNILENRLQEGIDVAVEASLYELDAIFANRVWNQNEDINGKKFGKYRSNAYKEFRENSGKQILEKDLQFNNSLRNSVEIDFSQKALIFNNNEFVIIADGQERQLSTVIFEASKEEVKKVIEVIEFEFTKFTKSIIENT